MRLILLAHGSPDPRWRAPFERLARALQEDLGEKSVRLAFLEFAAPSLADVASEAAAQGVRRLRVLPLFMAGGGHVDRDIPVLAERIRQHHPGLAIEILPAVGDHPRFFAALREIARAAAGQH